MEYYAQYLLCLLCVITEHSLVVMTLPCADHQDREKCRELAKNFACISHKERMKSLCPFTCGFCKNHNRPLCEQTAYGCCPDRESIAQERNSVGCEDPCKDSYKTPLCKLLKRYGFCDSVNHKNCLKTCGHCRKCKDKKNIDCKQFKNNGFCEKKLSQALHKCRKTCSLCGKQDPCHGFRCKKDLHCHADHNGAPFCGCKRFCRHGSMHTGKVCGRNNKEYANLCYLEHEKCFTGNYIAVKRFGKCPVLPPTKYKRGLQIRCKESEFGCCFDGITSPRNANGDGCPGETCKDLLSHRFCKRSASACGHKFSEHTMRHLCYKTCNYCRQG